MAGIMNRREFGPKRYVRQTQTSLELGVRPEAPTDTGPGLVIVVIQTLVERGRMNDNLRDGTVQVAHIVAAQRSIWSTEAPGRLLLCGKEQPGVLETPGSHHYLPRFNFCISILRPAELDESHETVPVELESYSRSEQA